jgi:hypothetical protein
MKEQQRQAYHQGNLQGQGQQPGEAAQILHTLSEVDDLPLNAEDDPVMGQLISKLTSTANLSEEQVRSNEWVREYILILYLCKFPSPDGMHSSWRGWAHATEEEAREPLQPERRSTYETLVTTSKLALSRSEGAKVIEEGTRDVSESIVNDPEGGSSGGGIMGKLGL